MTEDNMAATATRLVLERAMAKNVTKFNTTTFAQFNSTLSRDNATNLLIHKLVFAESKSVRTSTIILAVFNVLAALATAASILYDCYMASKRCNPKFKASKFCVKQIHPAETFPLILSIGIAIQGIIFAGVQSTGLQSLFLDNGGCSVISQFMWPALFIVPYIQVVYGIECAVRSMRYRPFQPRGPYAVKIYTAIIILMLAATWVPSNLYKENDVCFPSLMWFLTRYGELGIILLSISGLLMLMSALTIFFRVSRVDLIDDHQRIAASRMVYYLVLGVISLAFVIPFFVSLVTSDSQEGGDIKAAMMATVVVNLSGLISGLLQVFLRSNTVTTSFGPSASRDRKKHQIRIFGPNDLVFNNQLISPVSGPGTPRELTSRSTSRASLLGFDKETRGRAISMDSLMSPTKRYNNPFAAKSLDQKSSEIASGFDATASTGRGHARKPSYSLFPADGDRPTTARQEPVSIYDISDLTPPPAIYGARGHKRDSSIASSATVQIGLRISHAPPSAPEAAPLSLPSTTYNANATPRTPPSPLKVQTKEPTTPPRSPKKPSPLNTAITTSPIAASCINKTLPPTPKPTIAKLIDATTQLSPAVYSPAPKTNSMPRNPLRGNPPGSPLSQPKKRDWI